MEKLMFNGEKNFYIAYTSNKNRERSHYTFFRNDVLEKYKKEKKLDLHYELHFSTREKFIRFDCHAEPYKSYKTIELYKKYVDDKTDNYKRILYDVFKNEFENKYRVHKNYKYNNTFLIKKVLDNKLDYNQCIKEIEKFINDTYDKALTLMQENLK